MNLEEIVRVPYTTQPHMKRYDGPLLVDPDPKVIEQKRIELRKWDSKLFAIAKDNPFVGRVSEHLNLQKTKSIVQLALQMEEDFAILHKGRLHEICFCFPSSWKPAERVGMTLEDIHRPVGDGQKLVEASQRIAHTISTSGPYRRHVWTLSNSGELSQYPDGKSSVVPHRIEDLWFRMEVQTTSPLGDGDTCLFLVQVLVVPLSELWRTESNRILLTSSIESMSENVLRYKGLENIKKLLYNNS